MSSCKNIYGKSIYESKKQYGENIKSYDRVEAGLPGILRSQTGFRNEEK